MNAYTIADAWIFLDIPKSTFRLTDFTRLAFRVRNLGDKKYAIWSDTAYLDQVILGPPRTYEVSASFRFLMGRNQPHGNSEDCPNDQCAHFDAPTLHL